MLDKKKELGNLINSISNYSHSFIDSLNIYKTNTEETLENLRKTIIEQFNDKYSLDSFKLDEDDEEKLKEIIELFQKKTDDNFNLK